MDKYNSSDFFKMAGIKASIDIETYERDMKEKDKELERYKNIIDELETYFIDMFNRTQDTKYLDDLQKLKELKGSDN